MATQATSSTPFFSKSGTSFAKDGTWPFSQTPVKAPGSAKRTTFLPAKSCWSDVPAKPARDACLPRCSRAAARVRPAGPPGPKKLRGRRRSTTGRRAHTVGLGGVPGARRLQSTRRQRQQILTGGDAAARRGAAGATREPACCAEHALAMCGRLAAESRSVYPESDLTRRPLSPISN